MEEPQYVVLPVFCNQQASLRGQPEVLAIEALVVELLRRCVRCPYHDASCTSLSGSSCGSASILLALMTRAAVGGVFFYFPATLWPGLQNWLEQATQ
eukprot:scaffold957_cov402-Prasinococcus_capsulatus_cf.AAC.12